MDPLNSGIQAKNWSKSLHDYASQTTQEKFLFKNDKGEVRLATESPGGAFQKMELKQIVETTKDLQAVFTEAKDKLQVAESLVLLTKGGVKKNWKNLYLMFEAKKLAKNIIKDVEMNSISWAQTLKEYACANKEHLYQDPLGRIVLAKRPPNETYVRMTLSDICEKTIELKDQFTEIQKEQASGALQQIADKSTGISNTIRVKQFKSLASTIKNSIDPKKLEGEKQDTAATKIQALAREHLTRKKVKANKINANIETQESSYSISDLARDVINFVGETAAEYLPETAVNAASTAANNVWGYFFGSGEEPAKVAKPTQTPPSSPTTSQHGVTESDKAFVEAQAKGEMSYKGEALARETFAPLLNRIDEKERTQLQKALGPLFKGDGSPKVKSMEPVEGEEGAYNIVLESEKQIGVYAGRLIGTYTMTIPANFKVTISEGTGTTPQKIATFDPPFATNSSMAKTITSIATEKDRIQLNAPDGPRIKISTIVYYMPKKWSQ